MSYANLTTEFQKKTPNKIELITFETSLKTKQKNTLKTPDRKKFTDNSTIRFNDIFIAHHSQWGTILSNLKLKNGQILHLTWSFRL